MIFLIYVLYFFLSRGRVMDFFLGSTITTEMWNFWGIVMNV